MFGVIESLLATRRRLAQDGVRAKLEGLLILLSVGAGLTYLLGMPWPVSPARFLIKVLAIAPLLAMPLSVMPLPRRGLLCLSLLCSVVGDVLLIFPGTEWMLGGLISFLLAHILYIYLFWRCVPRPVQATREAVLGSLLLVIGEVCGLCLLWPGLGSLRLPVVVYATALVMMNVSALFARLPGVFLGALLFLISDTLLGFSSFRGPLPALEPLSWATYYAAQFLIVSGYVVGAPRPCPSNQDWRRSCGR